MFKTTAAIIALSALGADAKKVKCSTPVQYEVTITNYWTDVYHPNDFPSDAHLSPSIGVSHSSDFGMWAPGFLATAGVQSIAESGSTTAMETQISDASAYVLSSAKLGGGFFPADISVPETLGATLTLDVSEDFSKVSTMHMLAGSPDWFTGVSGLDLCENGKWAKSVTVTSQPYDAGTDCGVSYASSNCVESPQQNVHSITAARTTEGTDGPIFVKDGDVAPVAKWTFTIVEEASEGSASEKSKSKPKKGGKGRRSLRH